MDEKEQRQHDEALTSAVGIIAAVARDDDEGIMALWRALSPKEKLQTTIQITAFTVGLLAESAQKRGMDLDEAVKGLALLAAKGIEERDGDPLD